MEKRTIDDLLNETHDPDPRVRKQAARDLCPCEIKTDDPKVWNRVFELTADPDPAVRKSVFHTLIDGSPKARETDVLSALERLHNDPDRKLRRIVRKVLARYRATGKINHDHT